MPKNSHPIFQIQFVPNLQYKRYFFPLEPYKLLGSGSLKELFVLHSFAYINKWMLQFLNLLIIINILRIIFKVLFFRLEIPCKHMAITPP